MMNLLRFVNWKLFLFVQYKFAFLSLGRPEYLQDDDAVASRFQVCIFQVICYFIVKIPGVLQFRWS